MARAKQPESERRDFYLFIDEFQSFSTDAFASILAEARKYRLCLTLSHPYIDQLSLAVRQAVFGNVGTLITFRIGHADAEILEKQVGRTFTASAFSNLDRFEIVLKLLESGANWTPFLANTLPPVGARRSVKSQLVEYSQRRFATPRAAVEVRLNRWIKK